MVSETVETDLPRAGPVGALSEWGSRSTSVSKGLDWQILNSMEGWWLREIKGGDGVTRSLVDSGGRKFQD